MFIFTDSLYLVLGDGESIIHPQGNLVVSLPWRTWPCNDLVYSCQSELSGAATDVKPARETAGHGRRKNKIYQRQVVNSG